MRTHTTWTRLLVAAALFLSLALAALPAFAQDATEAVDDTNEAGEEGVAAEASEAQEVGGETDGIEEEEGEPALGAVAGEEGEAAAEAGGSPLTKLGINTGFLLAQIVNFLLIFAILRFALWGPIVNMLDSRRADIEKGLEDASAAANARRNAEAEAERILAAARADAARVVEEARGRGEELARTIQTEANTEAERIRNEGRTRANEERDRQLADMRSQVVNIAVAMAERLVGASIDPQRQSTIVSDFFSRVPEGARALAGDVEVVSAMPLSEDEQNSIRGQIGGANVTFSVDPNILGGLVLRTSDRVVDGSVRSSLTDLAGRLR